MHRMLDKIDKLFCRRFLKLSLKIAQNCHLVLVGGGDYQEELKKLVSSLNMDDKVYFFNNVPQEELKNYYNSFDVFVDLDVHKSSISATFLDHDGFAKSNRNIGRTWGKMKNADHRFEDNQYE